MKVQREGDNNHVIASESPEADHNRNAVKAEQVEVGSRRTGVQEKTHTGGAPDVVGSRVEGPLPPPEANCVSDSSPDRRDNKLELQGTRTHARVCVCKQQSFVAPVQTGDNKPTLPVSQQTSLKGNSASSKILNLSTLICGLLSVTLKK